jgi:phosphoglycerate kinase
MRSLDSVDVERRRVLVRVDFNVPLRDGEITDDTRIRAALPTIDWLRAHDAKIILVSHLGRPKGGPDPAFALRPVATRLAQLTGAKVEFATDSVGESAAAAVAALAPGEIVLLENIRFEPGETKNDDGLAEQLASLCDVYVNDAFGSAHRAHASTEGITHHVADCAAGLLLEREVSALSAILTDPARPLVAVLGGSKVTDKIGVIERFLELADAVLIGGAMCFPFFKVQGRSVGGSLCEEEGLEPARDVLERGGAKLVLPSDLGIGERVEAGAERRDTDGVDVPDGWMGLDIGPRTAERYAQLIREAGTVFWNGPMGVFEVPPFDAGTRAVAQAVADCPGTTVAGGGDSVAALAAFGLTDRVTHVSTGGGATLELVEGRVLPGVAALA